MEPGTDVTAFQGPCALAGFEFESSWRTRKHVKGDYLNLLDLGAAIGVIVLAGSDDPRVQRLRQFAETIVARPAPRGQSRPSRKTLSSWLRRTSCARLAG